MTNGTTRVRADKFVSDKILGSLISETAVDDSSIVTSSSPRKPPRVSPGIVKKGWWLSSSIMGVHIVGSVVVVKPDIIKTKLLPNLYV